MRVGIFHNRYQQRGGEDAAVEAEAELLAKGGHEVARFSADNADAVSGRALGALRTALGTRWNPETPKRVARFLAEHPLDVAHVHNFFPVLSPSLHAALAERGVPVVQTLHNYRLLCANGLLLRDGRVCEDCVARGPWNAVRHACYRGSRLGTAVWADMVSHHRAAGTWTRCVDRFTAPSDFLARKLVAAGLPRERIVTLPLAVADPGEPTAPGRGAVFAGRLSREKGVDLLIDAWRALAERGLRAPLEIAGSGPEEEALRRRAAGLEEVRFLGQLDRAGVQGALRRAAFAVVPSRWYENSPVAALEALACGRAVVVWSGGAAAELIEPGTSGLCFEAPTPESLLRPLSQLLGDAALLAQLGAGARERYLERHTPALALARLESLYSELSAVSRAGSPGADPRPDARG